MPHKKVIEDIEFEIERIENLIEKYKPLLKKVKRHNPDFVELGSLAMLLHSFYNGMENIFSCIAKKIDERMPQGEGWHKELLEQMARYTKKRKLIVLNAKICKDMEEYLGFRHFSRHAYAFDLDWMLMKDLVKRLDNVKERALNEVRSFITKLR